MSIPARQWNRMIDRIFRNRILGVRTQRLSPFVHPWRVSAAWHEATEAWALSVRPGYINAGETEVRTRSLYAPARTLERLDVDRGSGDDVLAWLSEGPRVFVEPENWRRLGVDGAEDGDEAVPEYFLRRGVLNQPGIEVDGESGEVSLDFSELTPEALRNRRLLRACEVVVRQPRIATMVSVETDPDGAQAVLLDYRQPEGLASLSVMRRFSGDVPLDLLPVLAGGEAWSDLPYQSVRVATVFLLSRSGVPEGASIDGSWSAHVRHEIFWNLSHAVRVPDPPPLNTERVHPTGGYLAGGIAAGVIEAIQDEINRKNAEVEALLAATRVESRVWSV